MPEDFMWVRTKCSRFWQVLSGFKSRLDLRLQSSRGASRTSLVALAQKLDKIVEKAHESLGLCDLFAANAQGVFVGAAYGLRDWHEAARVVETELRHCEHDLYELDQEFHAAVCSRRPVAG
jgi:hypothetical protein